MRMWCHTATNGRSYIYIHNKVERCGVSEIKIMSVDHINYKSLPRPGASFWEVDEAIGALALNCFIILLVFLNKSFKIIQMYFFQVAFP